MNLSEAVKSSATEGTGLHAGPEVESFLGPRWELRDARECGRMARSSRDDEGVLLASWKLISGHYVGE